MKVLNIKNMEKYRQENLFLFLKSDLIIPVGRCVLKQSLEAVALLQEKIPQIKVHVNISYI